MSFEFFETIHHASGKVIQQRHWCHLVQQWCQFLTVVDVILNMGFIHLAFPDFITDDFSSFAFLANLDGNTIYYPMLTSSSDNVSETVVFFFIM